MNMVNVTVSTEQDRTLAIFDGELTIYAMESLSPILPELAQSEGLLTVDLSAVSELDGSGFQFLQILTRHRRAHSARTEIIAGDAVHTRLYGLGLAEAVSNPQEVA